MEHMDYILQIYTHYRFSPHRANFITLCHDWVYVQAGKGSSTDRIMASAGSMPAWIAYRQSLAKAAPGYRNFAGKMYLEAILNRLHMDTDDVRRQVAKGRRIY